MKARCKPDTIKSTAIKKSRINKPKGEPVAMQPIRIKSYEYMLRVLLFIVSIFPGVIAIAVHPFVALSWIFGGLFAICFLCAVFYPAFSSTYDIYSPDGVKRIRKSKVLFEVSWDEIKDIWYSGLSGILWLSPYVLHVNIKRTVIKRFPANLNIMITIAHFLPE